MERPRGTLDALPHLSRRRGCALSADERVRPGFKAAELAPHEGALGEAGAQEGGVDGQENPGVSGEDDGGE